MIVFAAALTSLIIGFIIGAQLGTAHGVRMAVREFEAEALRQANAMLMQHAKELAAVEELDRKPARSV
jgi:membrane protein DedA with SNARE-associated domain